MLFRLADGVELFTVTSLMQGFRLLDAVFSTFSDERLWCRREGVDSFSMLSADLHARLFDGVATFSGFSEWFSAVRLWRRLDGVAAFSGFSTLLLGERLGSFLDGVEIFSVPSEELSVERLRLFDGVE